MSDYTHLTVRERRRFYAWIDMGWSISAIAKRLNRHRSTLYRELKRNQIQGMYLPIQAHVKSENRRKQGRTCKLQCSSKAEMVLTAIKNGWTFLIGDQKLLPELL